VGGNAWRRSREGEGRKRHRQAWVSGGYGFTFNDKGIGFFLSGLGHFGIGTAYNFGKKTLCPQGLGG
jgi:hypothetical protein